jgi:CO/xanthine dehydrogenase FAD-binding subunit
VRKPPLLVNNDAVSRLPQKTNAADSGARRATPIGAETFMQRLIDNMDARRQLPACAQALPAGPSPRRAARNQGADRPPSGDHPQ